MSGIFGAILDDLKKPFNGAKEAIMKTNTAAAIKSTLAERKEGNIEKKIDQKALEKIIEKKAEEKAKKELPSTSTVRKQRAKKVTAKAETQKQTKGQKAV